MAAKRSRLGGLLVRRDAWRLSLRGKAAALLALAAGAAGALHGLYPFLAITRRVPSATLVVDGWMPTVELEQAAAEYHRGNYQRVLAVRGVYEFDSADLDRPVEDYVADILVRHGVPRDRLAPVLFPGREKDRTFYSARAIGEWFRQRNLPLADLDLATSGAHARRSRLLYRQALGGGVRLGVVALDDPAFDGRHWWRSSEGIREVLFEGVAYAYVRLIFFPPRPAPLRLLTTSP